MSSTTSHPGAEPGHPEYYARLMLPETERDALLHLSNVAHRFYELLERPNEPELHNTRFQWWLEQLSAFREGNASLPALVALQDRQASNASLGNLLQQCLMAVNTEFVSDGFANQEELESFLQQRIGMLLMAELCLLTEQPEDYAELIQHAGRAIGWHYLYTELLRWYRQGQLPISTEWLTQKGWDAKAILTDQSDDQKAFHQMIHQAMVASAESSLKLIKQSPASCLQPLVTRLRICLNTQHKLRRAGFPLYQPSYETWPIKQLWLAWRTHQQLSKD